MREKFLFSFMPLIKNINIFGDIAEKVNVPA